MIPLPGYIDRAAWDGFCDMRAAMPKSKPFTTRAMTLILYELQRIKDAGYCPNAALDQSTLHGWSDVYMPQEKTIQPARRSEADKTSAWLAEQREHAALCEAQRLMRKARNEAR